MNALRWLDRNIEKIIIVAVTSLMIAMLTLQVVSRYAFNRSISWGEELSIFAMVWLAYFGASYAVRQRRHIRITILTDAISPKAKKMVEIACNFFFLAFDLFLVYGTWNMTVLSYQTNQVAAASGMPRWIAIAGMPLAFALLAVRLVQDTVELFREYKILASGGELVEKARAITIRLED
jgi:TRAP-type C4-dicarboxylate transport system permease small subunit